MAAISGVMPLSLRPKGHEENLHRTLACMEVCQGTNCMKKDVLALEYHPPENGTAIFSTQLKVYLSNVSVKFGSYLCSCSCGVPSKLTLQNFLGGWYCCDSMTHARKVFRESCSTAWYAKVKSGVKVALQRPLIPEPEMTSQRTLNKLGGRAASW